MLQRQIMFKQLEELQRQKKLQELNDSRQENVLNQQSLIQNKQASGAQYAPLINGTPVRDPSQMFMYGNTNLVHGFQNGSPYSQAQNQILHSMGLPSQPVDGHSFSRFSHFQGPTQELTGELVDTISRSTISDQFNVSYQTGTNQQEFGKGQEQDTINPSQEFTSLDPLEQKFLFTDDGSVGGFGSMFEDNDNLQGFPSVQSGSWSALMQSALEETSSTDTGVQEEWSGLSFQNPELSNDNQPSNFMENGKNPTLWQNNIFQNVPFLNSRPEASAQVQRFSPLQLHQGLSAHAGQLEFVTDVPDNGREFKKGFLSDNQSQSKASEVTTFRSSDSSSMSAIVDRSAAFPAPDLNSHTSRHMLELLHKVDKFKEYKHGMQSAYTEPPPTKEMPKATDAFTPSNNSSTPQYFGLRLAPPTQRPPVNYFDSSQISQQPDTSHLVPLKDQDSQRLSLFESQQVSNSTRQSNVWVDIPSQQNLSGVGFHKAPSGSPSTSDVANSRIETYSEAPKESDSQMYDKGGNDLLEASGHVLNSQAFDCKIPFEEGSFSGRAEVSASLLNQTHSFPPNPTYSDPNMRAAVKNEKVNSDIKVPLLTSMSQLTSVYENYKTTLVPSSARESQLVRHSSHPILQDGTQLHRNNSFVQMNLASTSQYGSVWPVTGTSSLAVSQDLLVSQSKKRKFPTYEFLPWHTEAKKGSSRFQDMSIAELEWAQAAKRVPEKLKEEEDAPGESPWRFHSKKRIILTTQLMQMLFRPAPATILSGDATTCYNTISYFAARLALGDACSLANHSQTPCDTSDSLSGKATICKGSGDQNLSKIVENFIDRAKKLEDELLRLESSASVLEIRMESQDLERFSVINRFAKFHSRPPMVVPLASASGVPKLHPQRYVTASPMPKIVPQGHNCLSL